MGKDFLNLKIDQKKLQAGMLLLGIVFMTVLGINAFRETKFENGYVLQKNKAGDGAYEQDVIAVLENEKIPLTIQVEEQVLSEKEAMELLSQAKRELGEILKGGNETLSKVTENLVFADGFSELPVEIEWTKNLPEYFYADGSFREDVEILEPVECRVEAVLSCQEFSVDYEAVITIMPRTFGIGEKLLGQIAENDSERKVLRLPVEYEGRTVGWRKPMDLTFLYFGILMMTAYVFVLFGRKRDERKRIEERKLALEKDYAQVISKFTMLLSAGLSVRNAWERIVVLHGERMQKKPLIYEEMYRTMLEMQRGIPELEAYERFGKATGLTSYKKLMGLFIMEKRRGSINLLEAMNQEMVQAWEMKKRNTKQQGERAGTKLLIPMMGMLAVVFVMIMAPAFLSFQL